MAAAVLAAVALAGIMYALAGTLGTTAGEQSGGGDDTRATFGEGLSAIVQTEDRAVVQVRIRSVAETGFAFTATVSGLADGETGKWTALLDDGSEVAMAALAEGTLVSVSLDEMVAAESVREVRLDPDDSPGDIYFEVD
jgi:hypothetical protein